MIVRLAMVTSLIALFALSFSALAGGARQRTFAAPLPQAGAACLADGLICAPASEVRG